MLTFKLEYTLLNYICLVFRVLRTIGQKLLYDKKKLNYSATKPVESEINKFLKLTSKTSLNVSNAHVKKIKAYLVGPIFRASCTSITEV